MVRDLTRPNVANVGKVEGMVHPRLRKAGPTFLGCAVLCVMIVFAAPNSASGQRGCYPGYDCPEDYERRYDRRDYRESRRPSFSATSYCRLTGAVGYAEDEPSARSALLAAVADCIYRGGVPACCVDGAQLR